MKKLLLLPLMILTAATIVPGSNARTTNVEAEETTETTMIDGYISSDLKAKEKGFVDEYTLGSEKWDTPFLGTYDASNFNVCEYRKNTDLMDYIFYTSDKDLSQCKNSNASEYGYAYFYNDSGLKKSNTSIIQEIYSINTFFDYPYEEENHPMELRVKIDFKAIETFLSKYIGSDTKSFDYPILSIDGEDYIYFSYSSDTKKITYNNKNSKCYLGYQTNTTDNTYYKSGYVYVEIPYRKYIETIRVLTSEGPSKGFTENAEIKIHHAWTSEDKTKFMPFILNGIDVESGNLTYTGTSDNYELQSITIDNSYNINVNAGKKTDTEINSSFDTNNSFVKSLKANTSDKTFNVTSYKFKNKTTNETQLIDFGTFYAFKYITTDQIHIATFHGLKDYWGLYRRLAFNVYDNKSKVMLNKLSAIYFYYHYTNVYSDKGQLALSITAKDLSKSVHTGDGSDFATMNPFLNFDRGNCIVTQDEISGNRFWLTGLKKTDYWFFNFDDSESLKNSDKSEMFLLVCDNIRNIEFDELISCVYVDQKGTIINCSSVFPNGVVAPTFKVNEDGSVTIIDVNGNEIDGRVNENGVFEDKDGKEWEPPSNVEDSKPKDILDELLKLLKKVASVTMTVAIIGGVIWCISKLGPTIVAIFKKRE